MNLALNEIAAMAKRAAHGAGLDWGLAEEAAMATEWLAARGLPGPSLLADLLPWWHATPSDERAPANTGAAWHARGGTLCPLAAGLTLSDWPQILHTPLSLSAVRAPLFILPFVSLAAARLGQTLTLSWGETRLITDGGALTVTPAGAGLGDAAPRALRIAASGTCTTDLGCQSRCDLLADIQAQLGQFAALTYAPATEASRRLGAGSALSDND